MLYIVFTFFSILRLLNRPFFCVRFKWLFNLFYQGSACSCYLTCKDGLGVPLLWINSDGKILAYFYYLDYFRVAPVLLSELKSAFSVEISVISLWETINFLPSMLCAKICLFVYAFFGFLSPNGLILLSLLSVQLLMNLLNFTDKLNQVLPNDFCL